MKSKEFYLSRLGLKENQVLNTVKKAEDTDVSSVTRILWDTTNATNLGYAYSTYKEYVRKTIQILAKEEKLVYTTSSNVKYYSLPKLSLIQKLSKLFKVN